MSHIKLNINYQQVLVIKITANITFSTNGFVWVFGGVREVFGQNMMVSLKYMCHFYHPYFNTVFVNCIQALNIIIKSSIMLVIVEK